MNIFSLQGKVAVVTGAGGLLGREHVKCLSEAGAKIVACDINKEQADKSVFQISTPSLSFQMDVTSRESIKKVTEEIIHIFDRIDILVNNAAIDDKFESPNIALNQSAFENYPLELWQKSIEVNLTGTFLCSQIIGSEMAKRGSGSIINIASTYGIVAPDQSIYKNSQGEQIFYKTPAYPTTKGGVISFTRYLASYWGSKGVRVNCLSPGGVENGQDPYFVHTYSSRTMLKRMAQPSDYRGALIFLASDASSYMTGTNLIVDGGWTAI
ncbi:MAG: SDR family oxidoreductase [Thermodesulfovibrionales bacterium]|nr:SDR family oxidoreductase [Thermodesulfovibrionales bacterium]